MARQGKLSPVKKGTENLPWRVNVPASLSNSGKRERHFFATKSEAETFANLERVRIRNFGTASKTLSPSQLDSAAQAFRLLGSTPPTMLIEIVRSHLARVKASDESVTVKELHHRFAESKQKKGRSGKYLTQIRQAFSKLSSLDDRKLPEVNANEIQNSLTALAPSNQTLLLRVLRAAFNFAVKQKWIAENPVSSLDLTQDKSKEVEILTNLQVARLLLAAKRSEPSLVPYHAFGLFAGIRPEELTRLKWEDVHLQEGHITLPSSITKSRRRRIVRIEPALKAWVQWFAANHDRLTGRVTPKTNLTRRLRKLRGEAKLQNWVQDVMRHTYASNWLAKYSDIDALLLNLGHYSTNVLWEHYHKAVLKHEADAFWNLVPTQAQHRQIQRQPSLPR